MIGSGDFAHARQGINESGGGVLHGDVSTGEYECTNLGRLEGKPLELAITDAFVPSEDYPAALSGVG